MVHSDRGVVTAEFALSLPAVVTLIAIMFTLLQLPVARVQLALEVGELARAAARGEPVSGEVTEIGFRTCVTKEIPGIVKLKETACARTLGI